MNRKFLIILIILILLLGGAVGYTIFRGTTPEEAESISESRNAENLPSASVISDEEAAKITASIMLKQDASESGSDQVRIDGNTIYITQPGTYHLSGELKEGQLLVNVNRKDPVVLVLDNVSVTNSSAAALLAENTHNLSVYLAEGSSNTFTSGAETAVSLDSSDVSASGGATFDTEDRTEGWFAKAKHGLLTNLPKAFSECDRCRGLAFPCLSWGDSSDKNQFSIRLIFQFVVELHVDLGLKFAIRLDVVSGDTRFFGDFVYLQKTHNGDLQLLYH